MQDAKSQDEIKAQGNSEGADFAQYFESLDGKPLTIGISVILIKDKVREAKKGEIPCGVISAGHGIRTGNYEEWPEKYLKTKLGEIILQEDKVEIMVPKIEKVTTERPKVKKKQIEEKKFRSKIIFKNGKYCQVQETEAEKIEIDDPVFKEVKIYDEKGKKVIGKHRVPVMQTVTEKVEVLDENNNPVMEGTGKYETQERPKLNPKYDPEREYVPREKRPEWNCVGLLGQLPLRKGQPTAPGWIKIKNISKDVELWLVK